MDEIVEAGREKARLREPENEGKVRPARASRIARI
jgi:hypothetical protein